MFLIGIGAVVMIIFLLVLIEPVQVENEPDKKSECVDSEFSDWWPE